MSTNIESSEDEAIECLRNDLSNSAELAKNLHEELNKAFSDPTYSWKNVLEEFDVYYADNEDVAATYARRILWCPFFMSH